MQTVDVSKNNTIVLGRANEYGDHDTVVFDISSIRESVGDGEASLYYKRRGGEAIYIPSGVRVDGNTVVWIPSETDLGVESKSGECEIRYTYGNGRYISKTFGVIVLKSMVSDSDLTPEYEDMYDSWLKEIQKYVTEITTAKAIDSVKIGDNYELIINYVDGSSFVTPSLRGPKGDTGPQGIQGLRGAKGDKGDRGDRGPQGYQGARGPKGEKGDTGATGPKGEKGDTGPAGPKGEKGDKGNKGETGSKGDTGDTGPAGPKGDTGPQGPKGETGSAGQDGKDGASAYEQAVEGGYTGTERDFINLLATLKTELDSKIGVSDGLYPTNPSSGS